MLIICGWKRTRSVRVISPRSRPFSTTGSFLIFILNMSFTASSTSILGFPTTMGFDMTSQTLVFSGSLDLAKTRLRRSLSVSIPEGFSFFIAIKHPISCLFMSSTASFTVASSSMVTTSSTMTSSTSRDIDTPRNFYAVALIN